MDYINETNLKHKSVNFFTNVFVSELRCASDCRFQ